MSAYSFGTVNYNSEKVSEGNASFRIDVLNLNNHSLMLNPDVSGLEKGNISFQSDRIIEPSEISRNPEGDGWISIKPGVYAKPETFRFNVISSDESGEDMFKVALEAVMDLEERSSDVNQKVIQVREYEYEITFPDAEKQAKLDRGFDSAESQENSPEIIRSENDKQDQKSQQSEEDETVSAEIANFSKVTKINSTNSSSASSAQSSGIDMTTVILTAGLAGSIAYLWVIL